MKLTVKLAEFIEPVKIIIMGKKIIGKAQDQS